MTNFRNELIQRIKDSGQELIDRAESLVSPDLTEITDFSITLNFHQGEYPTITTETEVVNRRVCKRLWKKGEQNNE